MLFRSQDGPDHVDAHRTAAQVISPYTQRGTVDSTFYSTVSMLRTMELILGIAPLTQFDAQATPMLASFTSHPHFAPYDAVVPSQSLTQMNSPTSALSKQIGASDLTGADEVPEQLLNESIWKSVKGRDTVPPRPGHHR